MYIRKTKRVYKGKNYTNHLLVESVLTAKGPRQRTICSLGSLEPAPYEQWLALAHKMESALQGQLSLSGSQAPTALLLARAREGRVLSRKEHERWAELKQIGSPLGLAAALFTRGVEAPCFTAWCP